MGLLVAAALGVPAGAAAAPTWDYGVTIDTATGRAEVEVTMSDLAAPLTLCSGMDRSRPSISHLVEFVGGEERAIAADPEDDDCFVALPAAAGARRFHYRLDLADLAARTHDPDRCSRHGDDYVLNDQAILLRPEPAPDDVQITVTFHLPEGVQVAAPWQALPGPLPRFRYDAAQLDAGAYVAVGKLHPVGELSIGGGTVRVTTLDLPRRATDAGLLAWVRGAVTIAADFVGKLPGGRVHVVLIPIAGAADPGVFGTILRRALPSVVLLFSAEAEDARFTGEWLAVHELFHLTNPRIAGRIPWFIEGFTTYYQDVVRARRKLRDPLVMWGDLHDTFTRGCSPIAGRSLHDESDNIRTWGHYLRIYGGGACLAFRLDVAIRRRTKNRRSLDDVMVGLWRTGRAYGEPELVRLLDAEAGSHLVRDHLRSRKRIDWEALEKPLGIEPTGPDSVRLRDDAPEAGIRRGIF